MISTIIFGIMCSAIVAGMYGYSSLFRQEAEMQARGDFRRIDSYALPKSDSKKAKKPDTEDEDDLHKKYVKMSTPVLKNLLDHEEDALEGLERMVVEGILSTRRKKDRQRRDKQAFDDYMPRANHSY